MDLQNILWAALQRPPAERRSYLDEACGGDPKLRDTAEALLKSHEEAGSFLERPAVERASALTEEFAKGTRIGPYRLKEPIGEGGMGTVWRAEQERPVRREVALKVMRPWMASREFVARFEAERQALALMDHPNIARVFDAGSVGEAPYLVMELVQGAPLTRFCDERSLPTGRRLELLIQVCRGVQHAHERGVIHRDLKPTNVLVGLYGGEPVPKVIDFGVAKAIGGRLTDRTLHTEAGQVIGTLEYMSPEQARLDAGGVDIRSDVYALGVLLYELLTGTTPLERVRTCGLAEGLRVVEKEEPPPPSTRLSSMEPPALGEVARRRGTTAERLRRSVRGDLDWIAARCLEKDRLRRYASASALAEDLERHLAHRPVAARPPSAAYRLRKLVRRRPTASALCGASALLVVLAVGFAFRVQGERAERALRLGRIGTEVTAALREAHSEGGRANGLTEDLTAWQGALASAFATLRRAESFLAQAGGDADPTWTREAARTKARLQEDDRDRRLLARIEELRDQAARVMIDKGQFASHVPASDVVDAFRDWGIEFGSTPGREIAARIASRPEGLRTRLIAALHYGYHGLGPEGSRPYKAWYDAAVPEFDPDPWRREILRTFRERPEEVAEKRRRDDHVTRLVAEVDARTQPPEFLLTIANALPKRFGEVALDFYREIQRAHPSDFWANQQAGQACFESKRYDEAIRYFSCAVAVRPANAGVWVNLGMAYRGRETAQEIRAFERAVALEPRYSKARDNLGEALWGAGRRDEAIAMFRTAVECDPEGARPQHSLGWALRDHGQLAEGLAYLRRAVERAPKEGRFRRDLGLALYRTGDLHGAVAEFREAIALDKGEWAAFHGLGDALDDLGDLVGSAAAYRSAAALKQDDGRLHNNLGVTLRKRLDRDGAIEQTRKALGLQPDGALVHHNLGLMLYGTFDLDGAITSLRRALEIDPTYVNAANLLAGCLVDRDRASEAVEVLESVDRRLAPGDPRRASLNVEGWRLCARAAARLSDVLEGREEAGEGLDRLALVHAAAARRLFRAGARLAEAFDGNAEFAEDPDRPYRVARCAAWAAAGEGDASDVSEAERAAWRARALRSLRLALDGWRAAATDPEGDGLSLRLNMDSCRRDPAFAALREPRSSELPEEEREAWRRFWSELDEVLALTWKRPDKRQRLDLARTLWAAGQRGHALEVYREASECDPTAFEPLFWLGSTLLEAGKAEEALPHLRRAVELAPREAEYRARLGGAAYQAGELECAAAQLREAVAIDPKNVEARNWLGGCLRDLGDFEGAAAACRAAAELAPDDPTVMSNLGFALLEALEVDDALAVLRRAETRKPDDFNVQWNLALVLDHRFAACGERSQEDLDGAIDAYRKALKLSPTHPGAARCLARALVQRDQVAEAVAVLEKAWLAFDAKDARRELISEILDRHRRVLKAGETLAAATTDQVDGLDADQRFALAEAAGVKRLFRTAARMAAKAFEIGAPCDAGPRYHYLTLAFRYATLAATGVGEDATLSASDRAEWRSRALEWLHAWVEHWKARGTAEERLALREQIDVWRRSPEFEAVRDPGLSELPPSEQVEWRLAWAEVDGFFALASAWPR